MRTNDYVSVKELFNFHENILPAVEAQAAVELRPVSARIPKESYETLEHFAERWGFTKSALAAQLLETALEELELHDRLLEARTKADNAE